MGIGRGVGTTHLSIMVANYLANGRKKKVALLELNKNNVFAELKNDGNLKDNKINSSRSSCFKLIGIDFHRNIQEEDISKIMAENYDYIILDVSGNFILGRKEFLRSHKKIIVGSLSRWKAHEYYDYFEKAGTKCQDSRFLTFAADRKLFGMVRNNYGVNIGQIPFEEDPFHMNGVNIKWIEEIMK